MVREAASSDLEQILELYLFLHEDRIPEENGHLKETWEQILQDPNHHLLVNETDGRIVSSCVCVIIPNLTRNVRPYAFIENVVTHKDFRGKGYAGECLDRARQIAEAENCYKMMLLTGSKEAETLRFYEKAGYNSSDKTAFIQWLGKGVPSSISDTRKGFEESFAQGDFYNRQTQDPNHLDRILKSVGIRGGMRILDLGTGSGYLAFPMAREDPDCEVIGLDIVSGALEAGRARAEAEGIRNLSFVNYDGMDFPFEDGSFDLIVTRYALHHFPDIEHSMGEMGRVLKKGGMLFLSDPCPNACDRERFVDDYMRLKKDGHIRFYTKEEWIRICGKHDLSFAGGF